jgi:hypothetical protein
MRGHNRREDQDRTAHDGDASDRAAGPSTEPEDEADRRYLEEIDYQANVNQVRHEPLPVTEHDEPDQLAVRRSDQIASEHARTNPDAERKLDTGRPRSDKGVTNAVPGKPDGEVDTRRPAR